MVRSSRCWRRSIGVRRLLAQADAEAYGSLLDVLDDRAKTVARAADRVGPGPVADVARVPGGRCPTMITSDRPARIRRRVRAARAGDREPPGHRVLPRGLHGVMLRPVGAPEPGDISSPRVDLAADRPRGRRGPADSPGAARHPRGQRARPPRQSRHRIPPRFPRRRPAHALAARPDQARVPARAVEHFSTEFSWLGRLTGPAARHGRARSRAAGTSRWICRSATWKR